MSHVYQNIVFKLSTCRGAKFKFSVMNNKAFCNVFCDSQEFSHLSKILVHANAIVEFKEWLVASIIRVWKSMGDVKTLVNYRIPKAFWFNELNYETFELGQFMAKVCSYHITIKCW